MKLEGFVGKRMELCCEISKVQNKKRSLFQGVKVVKKKKKGMIREKQ